MLLLMTHLKKLYTKTTSILVSQLILTMVYMYQTLKNADAKGMFTIADEINDKAAQAHEGKLAAADMRNGSISISNIGSVGGGWFTPVINYPEVAILGVGTITQQPIVNAEGEIAVGRVMKLSLSFDHRIVDGATAQKAMNNIKRLLADPELLLMEG